MGHDLESSIGTTGSLAHKNVSLHSKCWHETLTPHFMQCVEGNCPFTWMFLDQAKCPGSWHQAAFSTLNILVTSACERTVSCFSSWLSWLWSPFLANQSGALPHILPSMATFRQPPTAACKPIACLSGGMRDFACVVSCSPAVMAFILSCMPGAGCMATMLCRWNVIARQGLFSDADWVKQSHHTSWLAFACRPELSNHQGQLSCPSVLTLHGPQACGPFLKLFLQKCQHWSQKQPSSSLDSVHDIGACQARQACQACTDGRNGHLNCVQRCSL